MNKSVNVFTNAEGEEPWWESKMFVAKMDLDEKEGFTIQIIVPQHWIKENKWVGKDYEGLVNVHPK